MNVPEITEVKLQLDQLKQNGELDQWELPFENLLTRRSASIFFVTPASGTNLDKLWGKFQTFEFFSQRQNVDKKLSNLEYQITFNLDDMERNQIQAVL